MASGEQPYDEASGSGHPSTTCTFDGTVIALLNMLPIASVMSAAGRCAITAPCSSATSQMTLSYSISLPGHRSHTVTFAGTS